MTLNAVIALILRFLRNSTDFQADYITGFGSAIPEVRHETTQWGIGVWARYTGLGVTSLYFTLWIFHHFCSFDLDVDPMTNSWAYISELHPYSLQIYRMCKYGLPTSRLSEVIVWHTYRQTDRYGSYGT